MVEEHEYIHPENYNWVRVVLEPGEASWCQVTIMCPVRCPRQIDLELKEVCHLKI